MDSKKINLDYLLLNETRPTTIKTRLFEGNAQLMRYDREVTSDVTPEDEAELLHRFLNVINSKTIDIVLLQDYNKGVLTKNLIRGILAACKEAGIPVLVDPKRENFLEYKCVDLIKPNLSELCSVLGHEISEQTESQLICAAEELYEKIKFKNLIVTLGENGIFYYDEHKTGKIVPPQKRVNAIDVTGAGDTVIAIAAVYFNENITLESLATYCNNGAGSICSKFGVSIVAKTDLLSDLSLLTPNLV